MAKYDIMKSMWFGDVGIVKVQTEYSGVKYYLGRCGQNLSGGGDEQRIAAFGTKVSLKMFEEFFNA